MTKQNTIVIIGGGYAGINLIDAMKKEKLNKDSKIILIDKHPYHFKKVKLFKAIVDDDFSNLQIPFQKYCNEGIEFIQGEVKAVANKEQKLKILNETGEFIEVKYDQLVIAVGSVIREVNKEFGGITLSSVQNARTIRQKLLEQIKFGKSKLRVTVIGGGITGIESSAEIIKWLKAEAEKRGIQDSNVEVILINDQKRLLTDLPEKISRKLESKLKNLGVKTFHDRKADRFDNGILYFKDGSQIDSDYCIWTVGIKPHPSLGDIGFPLTTNGKLLTDSSYRLLNCQNIYTIGDCAHIVDSRSGEEAGMTCKEAISQAKRLSKIIKADLNGLSADEHKSYPSLYCIGLGPTDGFIWAQKWGIDFVLSGRIGAKVREYTWNIASSVD